MKHLFLLVVLVILVSWIMASHRRAHFGPSGPPPHRRGPFHARGDGEAQRRLEANKVKQQARQAFNEARGEVRQALREARNEVRQALDEARAEVFEALGEAHAALVSDDDPPFGLPPGPQPPTSEREIADGLPVPIVPGTRVTEALLKPPVPPAPLRPAVVQHQKAQPAVAPALRPSQVRKVTGLISATEERAAADARSKLQADVVRWLDPEVPGAWTPPAWLLDAMVLDVAIRTGRQELRDPVRGGARV